MSNDSAFQKELTAYLESCHVGEFLTGTMEKVKTRVPAQLPRVNQGIHTIYLGQEEAQREVPSGYVNPTLTLPESPPAVFCKDEECKCDDCLLLYEWYNRFQATFDDILLCSNVHKCYRRRDGQTKPDNANAPATDKGKTKKRHATGKGCINRHGVCTARFPRDVYENTTVDLETGYIQLKKKEPWLNNVTPALTFACRCNTDTTCLQSGTGISTIICRKKPNWRSKAGSKHGPLIRFSTDKIGFYGMLLSAYSLYTPS
jgi:hypothetical protein